MHPNNHTRSAGFFLVVALLASSITSGCGPSQDSLQRAIADGPFDLWIAGGTVVDGSGGEARIADILIRADSIAYIGNVTGDDILAAEKIDAAGKVVTPGFIDTHAHGSPERTPAFDNFLAMGVTTISLGQDGGGLDAPDPVFYIDSLNSTGTGTNIVYFSGHGTLRMMSGVEYGESPSQAGIDSMVAILNQQLDAGFFGMTTGLEYTPGIYSGDGELLQLAKAVGARGGLIMSHMRNEDDGEVEESINELLRQGQYAPVHISHMKSVYGKGAARAEELLAILDSARAGGVKVTADTYPYLASYTGIGIVFPTWAKEPNDYPTVRRTRRAELAAYLRNRVTQRNGPEATLLGTGKYEGKTLADLQAETGRAFEDILIDDIGPNGASGAYFVMNEALQQRIAQDPYVMFCSDGSPTGFHPRGHGTFAKIIETYVRDKNLFSLEEAVRKMTSLPAQTIGLDRRGELKKGFIADIAIFDPAAVRATATYSDPLQLAHGFDRVLVGGVTAFANGKASFILHGRVLRKK